MRWWRMATCDGLALPDFTYFPCVSGTEHLGLLHLYPPSFTNVSNSLLGIWHCVELFLFGICERLFLLLPTTAMVCIYQSRFSLASIHAVEKKGRIHDYTTKICIPNTGGTARWIGGGRGVEVRAGIGILGGSTGRWVNGRAL